MDSEPLNALKLIISRRKQKILMSGHEHKAGYCLQAFATSLKGRTLVAEGICLGLCVSQAVFSDKDKPDKKVLKVGFGVFLFLCFPQLVIEKPSRSCW